MTVKKGGNQSTSDLATLSPPIPLDALNAVVAMPAGVKYIVLIFSNPSKRGIWLKPQPALTQPTVKNGIWLGPGEIFPVPVGYNYSLEWSALMESGAESLYRTYW